MLPFTERPAVVKEAQDAIDRCLALDPDSPTVTAVHWLLKEPFGQVLEQEKIVQTILRRRREQGNAELALPHHLECVGRKREAIAILHEYRRTNALPLDLYPGMVLWRAGEFAEGRALLERGIESHPEDPNIRAALVGVYVRDDEPDLLNRLLAPEVLEKYPLYEYSRAVDAVAARMDGAEEKRDEFLERMWAEYASNGAIEP